MYKGVFLQPLLYIIFYSTKVFMYSNNLLPTRSNFAPVTREFGLGYWRTIDNDYHTLKILGVMEINHTVSMGYEGRIITS